MKLNRYVVIAAAAAVLVGGAAAGYFSWQQYEASQLPAGIVGVNGRVEATQVDIATKIAGRVIEIVPHEGDIVSPGEVVALIDTSETMAELHQGAGRGGARPPNGRNPSGGGRQRRRPVAVRERGDAAHGDAGQQKVGPPTKHTTSAHSS